jgi:nitric oxide reductase NorD protein
LPNAPFTVAEIEEKLNETLELVLSTDRTNKDIALAIKDLSLEQQEFVIKWSAVSAKSNAELAYKFVENSAAAFKIMPMSAVHDWLIQAMDVYDKQGLYLAANALQDIEGFALAAREKARSITFANVVGVLDKFIRGLSGRDLKLVQGETAFTDTKNIFLPAVIKKFTNQADNYSLYKSIAAQLWAQTWYGTFIVDPVAKLGQFDDQERALKLFCYLETTRITHCINRDLPGLFREMSTLQKQVKQTEIDTNWQSWINKLGQINATVTLTYEAVSALYKSASNIPEDYCFQPSLNPETVVAVMAARIEAEKNDLQHALAGMTRNFSSAKDDETKELELKTNRIDDENEASGFRYELTAANIPVMLPVDVKKLLQSIYQDLGDIPPEYLVAAGGNGYKPGGDESAGISNPGDANIIYYDEWDYRRQQYRKNWCWLREKEIQPNHEPFVKNTVQKYYGLIMNIRKTFEALRGEDKLLKRQTDGDDIDLNAVVEAHADLLHGMEMTDRLFTRPSRQERNIAVMFMVDMSGSTKGWINDAEREALVLLCEALEILGDRYAIYGFSGLTRNRCEIYRIKTFDETYSSAVQKRIAGISPKDYTRMGVTIRHLTKLLNEVEARTKLLITLSDGKPDDFDGYRGDYGIEDTRQALIEAKHLGIHPFCITIDNEAHEYLPHMYGPVNYVLLNDVKKLPLKIADIYRQLTH